MNTLEMTDKRELLKNQAKQLIETAEKESRKLNAGEQVEFDTLTKEIAEIDTQIRKINEDNTKQINNVKETKMEKFSLLKAINDVANNRALDEKAQSVVNAGVAEMRKAGQNYSGQIVLPVEKREIQATVATSGQEVVAEDKLDILEPLRANLVLTDAGATYMTGLVGDVSIPTYTGSTVGWKGEIAAADDGAGTFGEVILQPKRLTAYLDISKQFLIQDSASAEEMLKNDIVRALSNKLEATILGSAAGSATQPAGIFNGASAATLTYAGTVAMEEELEDNNVHGELSYIVSPAAKATLRTTAKDSGSGLFVMENGEINGLPVYTSSACSGIVLGDWQEYVIAQWGGIDLTVDPYTQASNGMIRLVVNAYFDAKPRRSEAFVAGTVSNG